MPWFIPEGKRELLAESRAATSERLQELMAALPYDRRVVLADECGRLRMKLAEELESKSQFLGHRP